MSTSRKLNRVLKRFKKNTWANTYKNEICTSLFDQIVLFNSFSRICFYYFLSMNNNRRIIFIDEIEGDKTIRKKIVRNFLFIWRQAWKREEVRWHRKRWMFLRCSPVNCLCWRWPLCTRKLFMSLSIRFTFTLWSLRIAQHPQRKCNEKFVLPATMSTHTWYVLYIADMFGMSRYTYLYGMFYII